MIRFLPAAITPVHVQEILTALLSMRSGLRDFEAQLRSFFSKKYVYTFGSLMRATYACLFGLRKLSDRQKVILPRYSCPTFAHAVIASGLTIEYCDVDANTLALDIKHLLKINLDDVLAIVCANLFGLTSQVDKISEICKSKGVYIIEGVDYGIGTIYKNKLIGSWGDLTVLNFQEGKALPIGGGAIATDIPIFSDLFGKSPKKRIPNILKMLAFSLFSEPKMYGILIRLIEAIGFSKKKLSMEDTIRKTSSETDFKFNFKNFEKSISNFQGRLGCILLKRLNRDLNHRNRNAGLITSIIGDDAKTVQAIKKIEGVSTVHYIRYPVLIKRDKRDIILTIFIKNGIEASPMYVEHGMIIDRDLFPGAARVADELLTVPCHPYVTSTDIRLIRKIILAASQI